MVTPRPPQCSDSNGPEAKGFHTGLPEMHNFLILSQAQSIFGTAADNGTFCRNNELKHLSSVT